jgi:DNA-binding response OmpR family regulator
MVESTRILIADDDHRSRRSLAARLREDGYAVLTAADSRTALREARKRLPQLAIVDLLVPVREGFALARRLRRLGDVPVIMLTALDDEETKVRGLEGYAQDYVTKPFSYRELRARIKRVLGGARARGEMPAPPCPLGGGVEVDFARRQVFRPGHQAGRLSPTEARLLAALAEQRGELLPIALLLDRAWPDGGGTAPALWEYVRRLRRKLGDDSSSPVHLQSVRGVGYRLIC